MFAVLAQMAALLLCGVLWRATTPMGLDADHTRKAITGLVFVLLLPALVLLVLWRTPLGLETAWIAGVAAAGVLLGAAGAKLSYHLLGTSRRTTGTLILAAGWPNVTYLGLPVLEETLGEWSRSVAIQYDLFACTPLLLTLGILIARAHGEDERPENPMKSLLKVPPLWAAVIAVGLNLGGVPMNPWVEGVLEKLAPAVGPLMLIALGMGLRWDTLHPKRLRIAIPAIGLQLAILPLFALGLTGFSELTPEVRAAIILEAAMPTMVLGVVICDRYQLDSALYAAVVTVTTLLSLVTLPFWFSVLLPAAA